ncbi:MAG TPA: hypothetical protein VHD85_02445 [Terracidiphilus sp.]|nr:hypothetical protein [Terracidiphilus sp.]
MNPATVVVWILYLSPVIPIGLAWKKLYTSRDRNDWISFVPVLIATASQIWLISGSVFPWTAGPYYSSLRYGIIWLNFLVTLFVGASAFFTKPERQILAGAACLMLTLLWGFVGATNVVV